MPRPRLVWGPGRAVSSGLAAQPGSHQDAPRCRPQDLAGRTWLGHLTVTGRGDCGLRVHQGAAEDVPDLPLHRVGTEVAVRGVDQAAADTSGVRRLLEQLRRLVSDETADLHGRASG